MALGTSLFLIAVGAILAFAVTAQLEGLDVRLVGVILMVVGGVGLLLSLMLPAWGSPFFHRDEVIDGDAHVRGEHTYH